MSKRLNYGNVREAFHIGEDCDASDRCLLYKIDTVREAFHIGEDCDNITSSN